MKIIYSILILGFLSFQSFAQTFKGRVIDSETKQPIIGAVVAIQNTKAGANTDAQGYFRISNIAVGRYSIKISSIGYETVSLSEILIGSGKEVNMIIPLRESVSALNEVVVTVQKNRGTANEMATVSSHSFSVEQMKRYPAAWDDPARMATSFAGTATTSDKSNEIAVRGNSPRGLLWRMEGVEIPNPSHFSSQGASGGGVSALSANVLSNSDFYTGAFAAEYGNATSGVFDLKMRNGNSDKAEKTFQIGLQGIETAFEGPFSKNSKASYLVNYRYSTLGLISNLGLLKDLDSDMDYQDMAFKIFVPLKSTTFSLWGLGGLDRASNQPNKNGFYTGGLNSVTYLNPKSYWENNLAISHNEISSLYDYYYSVPNQTYTNRNQKRYINNSVRFTTSYHLKINAKNSVQIGGIISQLNYDVLDTTYVNNNGNVQRSTALNDKNGTQLMQAYAQWKYRINNQLSLNAGVHYMRLALNGNSSIEPRFGLKWQVNEQGSLNLGFGVHSRINDIATYMIRDSSTTQFNTNLPIPKSRHFVLGYEYRPSKDWRVNAEVYYQYHYDVGVANFLRYGTGNGYYSTLNDLGTLSTIALQGTGTGVNRGVELTVEKSLTNGFYLLNTTSIYEATYKGSDGIERKSRFDNNFVENFLIGKEWKVGKNMIVTNLKITWAGGLRIIPVNLPASIRAGYTIYDSEHSYERQFDNFFRADVGLRYVINKNKSTHRFSLDINNVTNYANPLSMQYNPTYFSTNKQLEVTYQLPLIPVLSYRIEF